jgi:hypothetical protein
MMRSVFTGNPAAGADDCCALAASGQDTEVTEDRAAAPPMMAMNARRDASKEPRRRVIRTFPTSKKRSGMAKPTIVLAGLHIIKGVTGPAYDLF